jgi:hypothetical protein
MESVAVKKSSKGASSQLESQGADEDNDAVWMHTWKVINEADSEDGAEWEYESLRTKLDDNVWTDLHYNSHDGQRCCPLENLS